MKHFVALSALAIALSSAAVAFADPPPDTSAATVKDRVERGVMEEARGRWDPAWDALSAAWAIEQTPTIAAALGRAEVHLGMAREAAAHLSYAIAGLPADDPARAGAFQDLEIAKQHIVTITLHVNPPGAMVFIDGVSTGTAPIAGELYLDEGIHTVRATMAGYTSREQAVEGHLGSAHDVGLALVPIASLGREAPPARIEITEERGRNEWVIAGGSLLGSATLAAGMGFSIAAATGSGDTAKMERLTALHLGVGAAILGATLTYAFWPSHAPESTVTRVVAAPVPLERGGAFALAGRF